MEHIYNTTLNGKAIRIHCGWSYPDGGWWLHVVDIDAEDKYMTACSLKVADIILAEYRRKMFIYSHLDNEVPYPKGAMGYMMDLDAMGIYLPRDMVTDICRWRPELNDLDRKVYHYHKDIPIDGLTQSIGEVYGA